MKDAIGRRKRYDPIEHDPKRDALRLTIGDRDRAIFSALHKHPQLPAHYLHMFTGKGLAPRTPKQTNMSRILHATTKRLRSLYHHGYLLRPEKQKAADNNKGQICTYELAKKAIDWLQEEDMWSAHASSFKGHPSHQFYLSCFTASMELSARRFTDIQYVSKEEIFARDTCPVKALEIQVNGEKVVPDSLFGIRFIDGSKVSTMYFVVELERAEKSSKQYRSKFHPYDTIIKQRLYKDTWGIGNLRILIPTVSKTRVELIKKQIEDLDTAPYFLFKNDRIIAKEWEVPPVWFSFFDEPWVTTKGDFFINRPKA